ncbi:MAG TPA: serine hydrolase domain-containing protein [Tepidisphaeraceae bacterium]|nr:serine hydrolase domain-containing protein [Tepidisphaeraceae bacterium]
MVQRMVVYFGILLALLNGVPKAAAAGTKLPATTQPSAQSLDALLEPIRANRKLPGLVAAIIEGDDVVALGAAGVRKLGAEAPITIEDKIHLGSCTKAMTATMLARLVERKQLAWESTIEQVFPELAARLNEEYRSVTLEQLLQHRAGLPAAGTWTLLGLDPSTTRQRLNLIELVLGKPPESKPGTNFGYSNVGYAVAAAMGEKVTGRSWEELIEEERFAPLGMSTVGMGAPGTKGEVNQPWGHIPIGTLALPAQRDNPPSLGPAGRVHCSIRDWAKFVSLHLRGARGEVTTILSPETFARLHRPPEGGDYALGWMTSDRPWAGGTALMHAGSNTMWHCVVWIAPKKNFAVLAATNIGGEEAARGCDDACASMIRHYFKMRPAAALPTIRAGG